MKKRKAIILLSIIGVVLVVWLLATFLQFNVGIYKYNSIIGAINYDFDINGGTSYTLTLDEADPTCTNVDDMMKTFAKRLNVVSCNSYNIYAMKENKADVKDYDIVIETPDSIDLSLMTNGIAQYGELHFYGGTSSSPTTEILTGMKVIESTSYNGKYTSDGTTTYNTSIKFTATAYTALAQEMGSSSYYLKVTCGTGDDAYTIMDGTSALSISYFSDRAITMQSGTESGARQIQLLLSQGGIGAKYTVSYTGGDWSTGAVSASMGTNIKLRVLIVGICLTVLIIALLCIFFRGYGIISGLSFLVFALGLVSLLIAIPNITVSAPGLIGLLFAYIICADATYITIKRIQEEYANGKTYKAAFKTGFNRAFRPIITSHAVALIISLLLFAFTSGVLQSFAITLSIGIAVSFVSNVLITRMFGALILPLVKKPDTFFNFKRGDKENV